MIRTVTLVILQHERSVVVSIFTPQNVSNVSNGVVRRITHDPAKQHGAHGDAARSDHVADFGLHESYVTALRLRARNGTATRTVVVQELPGEVAASNSNCSSASNVPMNDEGAVLSERPELRQNVLAPHYHLRWVASHHY